ncbi:MAG: 50S ribosomal protein L9 [Candidatus Babeliales bacterium]
MKVYLRKDVERIGMQGEIVKVSDGFAKNFLFPKQLAVEVTPENESFYITRQRKVENRKEVIATQSSLLAEKIKTTQLVLKRKLHDGSKLYGSISPVEIVDALAEKGIKVAKNQILFDKSIKEKGSYEITIKLSSRLQPKVKISVVAEG